MPFESLSLRHTFELSDFPEQWLPLTYLYDPDLPLFPLHYFHFLDPALERGQRPGENDRVFGFIHHINFLQSGKLSVTVITNKQLDDDKCLHLRDPLIAEVKERLGLGNPIRFTDLQSQLTGRLSDANNVVRELWHQIIQRQFGNSLPFGRLWDGVFGLIRFIASWNSDKGRKAELIQLHYFCASFGVRIHAGGGVHVDFFLLPTFEELTDTSNPLALFPEFSALMNAAEQFVRQFTSEKTIANKTFSAFSMASAGLAGSLDTRKLLSLFDRFASREKKALFENYNAFNRGPGRSIISLLMLDDIRNLRWDPSALTQQLCAEMYTALKASYQTPKVIQLYAQQCFGSECALPIDNWVKTFIQWPFAYQPTSRRSWYSDLFASSTVWGKLERLIWMASQARKVHSSSAAEILWCVRYGGPNGKMRGANPLSCKVCLVHVRDQCPAYDHIKQKSVEFNVRITEEAFLIKTSGASNTAAGQVLTVCEGPGTLDEYTMRDREMSFRLFPPVAPVTIDNVTVEYFIRNY